MSFDGYNENYNRLLGLDDATKAVASADFDAFMSAVRPLFSDSFLKINVGVSLLHRHHALSEDEIMVEDVRGDTVKSYITASTISSLAGDVVPSIWDCKSDGTILPFEFARDGLSKLSHDWFSANRPFFADFACAVAEHGLEGLVGMCSLHHGSVSLDSEDLIAVEETSVIERSHHVTIRQRSFPPGGFGPPTAWNFAAKKSKTCFPYRECVERSPGHSIVRGHEYVDPC